MENRKVNVFWKASRNIFYALFFDRKWDSYKVGIAFILASTLMALSVAAAETNTGQLSGLTMVPLVGSSDDQVAIGTLPPAEAAMLSTEIEVVATGFIVRTTVKQAFENQSSDWMEGIYKFPLPDQAFVDGMVIMIGGRC